MTSIDRSDPVILGHVLAEHRELFCQMMAVRNAFAEEGPPTKQRIDAIVAALKSLREHLRTHFRQEESGGFLEESISRMPRLAAAATEIVKQHPALLAELDAMIDRLIAGGPSAASWEQADRDFETFSDHMSAHEKSENAVVQEGYNEDLGLLD
jgi:hypothetical protein